jgi:hypothetical protein
MDVGVIHVLVRIVYHEQEHRRYTWKQKDHLQL